VHVSFVRSTTLDTWSEDQLKIMSLGGNGRARAFFKQHGWDDKGADKIEPKYTSRAAQLYKQLLVREAEKDLRHPVSPQPATGAVSPTAVIAQEEKKSQLPLKAPVEPAEVA